MVGSVRVLRWLCWALVVLAIVSAIVSLGIVLGYVFPMLRPYNDLVERLVAFRAQDQNAFVVLAIGSLASLGAFLVAGIIGMVLRTWAADDARRDTMTVLFVIGAAIGVASQLLYVAVAHAGTFGYCDCGYRTEEVIAQDYSLIIGRELASWLQLGALALVGGAVALAGRLVAISAAWRTLSYLIGLVLAFAVLLRLIETVVQPPSFNLGQLSDVLIAIAIGIGVPIWAILLARGAASDRRGRLVGESAA